MSQPPAPPTLFASSSRRADRFFESLGRLQSSRPFAVLLVALITVAISAAFARKITLKTALGELLPENKESVIVAQEVSKRLIASSTLFIVAEGPNPEPLKRFVDALAPALRALPPGQIGAVDDGVRESRKFFEANAALYAPLEDVQKVHDEILERYEREVQKRAGLDLGLDDEGEGGGDKSAKPSEPITAETIREKLQARKEPDRFPDGYYMEPDKKLIAVLVRTPVSPGDLVRSEALLATVKDVIAKVGPERFDPAMTIGFTGNLITGMEEYSQIKGDLGQVGLIGVLMILGVVFLFYMRVRALLVLALSVGVGTMWTFGLTYLLVGSLNSSTGFLVSIVVGNGINFGIIYMARYMEARRDSDVHTSVYTAHVETWSATLAGAGAAMVAYGSLVVTDFRGFKHFGVIGGSGMMLCWAATYLFLPALLAPTRASRRASAPATAARSPSSPAATRGPSPSRASRSASSAPGSRRTTSPKTRWNTT
jgi:predicted RND superfamily exporter protein